MELALLYQSRQVRCRPVREADFVEVETRTEAQYNPEVEPACVSERAGTRQGFECWLERLAQHAQRVAPDFDSNPAAAVHIVCCFVVDLPACSHEDGGGFGQVSAGFFMSACTAAEYLSTSGLRASSLVRAIFITSVLVGGLPPHVLASPPTSSDEGEEV